MSDIDTAAADSLKVLDPKRPIREADITRRQLDVRFGPIADMGVDYSITSSARASTAGGIVRPSFFAVLRLTTSSNLGRRLHWEVGRLLAFENAIDITRRTAVWVNCMAANCSYRQLQKTWLEERRRTRLHVGQCDEVAGTVP